MNVAKLFDELSQNLSDEERFIYFFKERDPRNFFIAVFGSTSPAPEPVVLEFGLAGPRLGIIEIIKMHLVTELISF